MHQWRVGIIGAGIGGLCLAQGLARAGIAFEIHESDLSIDSRDQGYRLRIDDAGQQALAHCLTPANEHLWRASCPRNARPPRFIDPGLRPQEQRVPRNWSSSTPPSSSATSSQQPPPASDLCVHRQTLREILCDGLQQHIHWNHPLQSFRADADGVDLHFADTSHSRVDLLVAADGVGSRVRRQLLPHAAPQHLGALCLYGKTPLTPQVCQALDSELLQGTTVVFAQGFSLVIDPMRFPTALPLLPARHGSGCRLTAVEDYLYWAFIGPDAQLGGECPAGAPSTWALQERIRQITSDWHPQLRKLLEHSDPQSLSARPVLSASHIPDWPSGRVTWLGDAIHAMSPAGGLGANSALCDAALLAQQLATVSSRKALAGAIYRYEEAMRLRVREALKASFEANQRLFGGL